MKKYKFFRLCYYVYTEYIPFTLEKREQKGDEVTKVNEKSKAGK